MLYMSPLLMLSVPPDLGRPLVDVLGVLAPVQQDLDCLDCCVAVLGYLVFELLWGFL